MCTKRMRPAWVVVGLWALMGLLYAAEPGKEKEGEATKDQPAKTEGEPKEPEPKRPAVGREDMAAKVDDFVITRSDLEQLRRQIAAANPQAPLNNKQILDQLINRVLWQRYFDKNNLRPTGDMLKQAVAQLDAELRRKNNMTYQQWLTAQGMRVEDHLASLSYELAMRRVVANLQEKVTPDEIKTEYDAHPDWYDGSRVRLSVVFVNTATRAHDPKEMEKAKQSIDKVYEQVVAGKDFDRLAADYSEGGGGDRGWFVRKGADVDEELMTAAWHLKAGEYTKPILATNGWYIVKVTEREPATFTFHGCKPNILRELTRRRYEALLEKIKADAKIETYL